MTMIRSQDLDSCDQEKWSAAIEIVQNLFKEAVNVSNLNLTRNANNLISTLLRVSDGISWVGSTKKHLDSDQFKLMC